MRTIISIALILILLFNVLGLYGVYIGWQYKAANDLDQQLDNNHYAEQETITIKVPIAIPYHTDTDEYERVSGEFEYEGEFYRMVKQKLSNDTLHIVCIRDHDSKAISKALTDYVKTFSDKTGGAKHHKVTPSFAKEYTAAVCTVRNISVGYIRNVERTPVLAMFIDHFSSQFIHPPERA